MKAVACFIGLCLLAGAVTSDYAWEQGKQYRYQVRGRVMAGIAEIDTQYSGLQLEYVQLITVTGPNVLNVKIEDLKAIETNEELENGAFRDGQIRKGQEAQIPTELRHFLTAPMDMILEKGVVQSIRVPSDLPTWAVNMKKAQASTFILDTTGQGSQGLLVQGNLNRVFQQYGQQANSVRGGQQQQGQQGQDENQESGFFYKTLEQSVHGECEVYYTVSQNGPFAAPFEFEREVQATAGSGSSESSETTEGKYQSKSRVYKAYKNAARSGSSSSEESSQEKPWPRAFNQLCEQNDQVYEIVKTVNFTACTKKPALGFSTFSELNFQPADNNGGSLWARALVSRYVACGQNRRQYTILKISQQERFHSGLQAYEKVVAGAQKNVTLLSIVQGGQPTPVQNPKTINSLVYTFDPKEQELIKAGQLKTAAQINSGESTSQEYQQDAAYMNQNRRHHGNQKRSSGSSSSEETGFGKRQQKQYKSQQAYQTSAEGKGQLPQPSLDQAPLVAMLITPLKRDQMKTRINELMTQIAKDLTKSTEKDSIAEREVLSKISTVVKILRVLNAQGIQEVAQKWAQQNGNQEQEVARSIFVDALAMAGTNPAVVYLLKQIKAGQLNGEEAAQVLATLPMYIRTPTKELLEKYFELIEDQQVKSQTQVRTTAMLSFSTLVFNACVDKQTKNTRFPTAIYGQFCDEQLVAKKFVPYFVQKLEQRLQQGQQQDKHWIVTLLAVLGNLGHPDTIEVVQKIMDQETDQFIKTKAIFALKNLIKSRSTLNQHQAQQGRKTVLPVDRQSRDILTNEVVETQVLPLLVSVAFDKSEHPQVRNAALSLLLHCTYADVAIWQQIALSTWFESSRNVRSFIVSSLKSLAQDRRPLKHEDSVMIKKARAVLPLAKPIDASIARSHNLFGSKFIGELNSGFTQQLTYFQAEDSIIPTQLYYRNYFNFGNGAAGVHPVEFSVAGNTIQKLASAFVKAVDESFNGQQGQQQRQEDRQAHQDLRQIKQLLNIEQRQQEEPIQGAIYLKLRDEIERMWTFDEQTVQQLAQQLAQNANSKGELNVNYQKAVHMAEHLAAMPTIMGIPLVYHMQMPALVSIRGTIKMNNQQGQQYAVQADLAPVYAWKIHRQLAFKVPFTGKKYQAGVQRHFVVEAPFSAVLKKAVQGQLEIALTPAHLSRGAPTGTINLISYHQLPYTAVITDEFYPTNFQQGGKMTVVRANEDRKDDFQRSRQFGDKSLGLVFQVNEHSDFPKEQETVSGWSKFIRNFHTANCAFNAAWLGSPSIRFVKREIVLDLDKSQTKTLVLLIAARRQRSSVARDLQSSEETSEEQQKIVLRSGAVQSSSSESEEGHSWFKNAQSGQYKKTQHKSQQQKQQKSGSQSSSESYESASYEQGQQGQRGQQKQQQSRGNILVVALLGKKAPLESLDELKSEIQNQRPLQKSSASTVQFLFQIQMNQGKLFSRVAMGEAVNQAAESLPESSRAFKVIREFILEAANDKSQPKACVELRFTVDTPKHASRHILAIRRESLLAKDLTVKVQAKLQAGQSCRTMPLEVTMNGKLRRDQEMTEWARAKSPQAKRCEQDKKKGFTVSQVCMDVSEQQAAALNQVQLHFQHSAMPKQIQNMTVTHIQNFLKAVLYPYMSENQFAESTGVQHNQFEIRARMTPNKEFVSFEIRKPTSILAFRDIKTGRVLKALLPLTATQTPLRNIKDRLFGSQSKAMCAIEKNFVNTFDNVTYSFNQQVASGCQHVLAQDCSGRYPMAVLVKDLQQTKGRMVTVLLEGQTKVQIIPQGGAAPSRLAGIHRRVFGGKSSESSEETQQQQSRMTVIVNGKIVQLPVTIRSQQQSQQQKSIRPIAEVMAMPNGGVQLIARRIQVATDGARVIVYASNEFRNQTCGLCGNFDNEKVGEMRSPKDFALSSGSLLVAAYAFQPLSSEQGQQQQQTQQGQCQIDQQIQRLVRKEEQQGVQQSRHIPKIYQRGQQYRNQQEQRRQQQQKYRQQQQKYQKQQQQKQYSYLNSQEQQQNEFSSESGEQLPRQYNNHHQSSSKYQSHSSRQQKKQQQQEQQQQQKFGRIAREGAAHQNKLQSRQQSSEERTNSQERRDAALSMTYVQKVIRSQDGQQECITANRVHVCAQGYLPKDTESRTVTVHCASPRQVRSLKEQIRQGQYVQLNDKKKSQMDIHVPTQCIKA